jgi:hypothetical protein
MSVKHSIWIGATLLIAACSGTTEPNVVQVGGTNPGTTTECRPVSHRPPAALRASAEPRCTPTEFGLRALPR